jgi:EmrB/QacA subfamily drug resistance transporter
VVIAGIRATEEHTLEPPRPTGFARLLIPLVVAFAFFLEQLDQTIIATAIPQMASGLGETPLRMNIALTSYILALAIFIPVSGWMADRFGMRRIFCTAIAVFTLGSVACGASVNLPMLLASRFLQGIGGAMMTPVGRLILLRSFPRSEFIAAMTWVSIPSVLGPVMGPLVGGFITTYWSWRWIFYVNVPFGLAGIALALHVVRPGGGRSDEPFDWTGFMLCGIGLSILQFGIENLNHPMVPPVAVVGLFVAGAALLVSYARYSHGRRNAALDLSLFRVRTFRVIVLHGTIARMAVNTVPFALPLMLQVGFGMSPLESGEITFASAIGAVAMRAVTIMLLRALGFKQVLVWNTILACFGVAGFALFRASTPYWLMIAYVMAFGMVRSTQFNTQQTLTFANITSSRLSRATSLAGVMQQLSVGFGVSMAATLLAMVGTPGHLTVANFHAAFVLAGLVPLLAMPGFLRLKANDGALVSGHRRSA